MNRFLNGLYTGLELSLAVCVLFLVCIAIIAAVTLLLCYIGLIVQYFLEGRYVLGVVSIVGPTLVVGFIKGIFEK